MYFDFTRKPNFEELEENNKLLEYIKRLESRFRICYKTRPILVDKMNNIKKYKALSEYINRIKLIEEHKQELKVMKKRETETNEYLKEVVKKMRDNLKL